MLEEKAINFLRKALLNKEFVFITPMSTKSVCPPVSMSSRPLSYTHYSVIVRCKGLGLFTVAQDLEGHGSKGISKKFVQQFIKEIISRQSGSIQPLDAQSVSDVQNQEG
uniref:Uncharacterized protein n=1 Tax=Romanomermis culicivorax TaxID=13658 RepID=A0A915JBT6_ROMCU